MTLKSPLDCKEIKPNPKVNQSWILIGRTDAEASILWPLNVKGWLIRKYSGAGKDWSQEEKVAMEDKMLWWHHWLNGYEFEQALGDREGQGRLVCYSPCGCQEWDMTEQLKHNKKWWFSNSPQPQDLKQQRLSPHSQKFHVVSNNAWRCSHMCKCFTVVPWSDHISIQENLGLIITSLCLKMILKWFKKCFSPHPWFLSDQRYLMAISDF